MSNPFILISLHSYRCLFSPCSSSSPSPCPRPSPSPPWLGPSVPQEKGADANAKDEGVYHALILASEKGHTEIAKFLVVGGEGGGTIYVYMCIRRYVFMMSLFCPSFLRSCLFLYV